MAAGRGQSHAATLVGCLKQIAAELTEAVKLYIVNECMKLAAKMDTSDKILEDHDARLAHLEDAAEKLRQIRRVA